MPRRRMQQAAGASATALDESQSIDPLHLGPGKLTVRRLPSRFLVQHLGHLTWQDG